MTVNMTPGAGSGSKTVAPKGPVTSSVVQHTPVPPVSEETFKLELRRLKRYMYGGHLYIAEDVYVFSMNDARHMLQLRDPQGLPVFARAKPKMKTVIVPVETKEVTRRVERIQGDLISFMKAQQDAQRASVERIELGDDDPEIEALLQQADAPIPEEIDIEGTQV